MSGTSVLFQRLLSFCFCGLFHPVARIFMTNSCDRKFAGERRLAPVKFDSFVAKISVSASRVLFLRLAVGVLDLACLWDRTLVLAVGMLDWAGLWDRTLALAGLFHLVTRIFMTNSCD